MDSGHDKKRMNVEDDRLSSLPDDLIHKILSFIGIKPAIETSVLSSRWRYTWTSMPYLDFSTKDFSKLTMFFNFVTHVLSHRNNVAEVFSMKLCFYGDVGVEFVKQTLGYAFSHNIQQLSIACFLMEYSIELPLSLFSSKSLKHLSLTSRLLCWSDDSFSLSYTATSTWELPALTTLCLHDINLCDDDNNDECNDLFSKCATLENLTLKSCRPKGWNSLSICNPRLSNLTLENYYESWEVFKVVAPQLKNLTIRNQAWERQERYWISAPQLASLIYNGFHPLQLSTNDFHSLEKVHLRVYSPNDADAILFLHLFKKFQSVKVLTLNLEIVEVLSSSVELISHQPSPFANIKSLNIYPAQELSEEDEKKKAKISTEVKKYLLDDSPSATFTLVSREEIRDLKNTKSAQKLMADLRKLLEREKAKIETNRAHIEQEKTEVDNELQIGGKVKHVNRCWKDLIVRIEQGKEKTSDIISELKDIKKILKKLPTSKRAELQSCFSSLCAEADAVVNNILDHTKFQCDMKRSRFSVYFQELASTSQMPSTSQLSSTSHSSS